MMFASFEPDRPMVVIAVRCRLDRKVDHLAQSEVINVSCEKWI
jgi:hypothetical protein